MLAVTHVAPLRHRKHHTGLMDDNDRWSTLSSVLLTVIASLCALSLLLRVNRVSLIASPRFTAGCGDWQQAYTKLHRQIISSRSQAKRLCVATTRDEKGLNDRLTGRCSMPRVRVRAPHHARMPRPGSVADSAYALRSAVLMKSDVR